MSQTKVKSGLLNFPDQTDFVKLPSGTTAQRPSSPEKGYSRYNTTNNKLEFWDGTIWQQLPGVVAPTIESVSYPGDDLAADPVGGQTITLTGTNFLDGATVEIEGTLAPVVTVVSATEITFTAPAKAAGDYDILLTNGDSTTATYVDGITYNGLPSWTTPAGNLGTFPAGSTIPTITLVATEPDSGVVSYSVTTGALPTGLTLTGADIDGTVPSPAGQTTYNFSVTASDDENQSTERAFNIVVYLQVTNTVDEVDPFGDSSGVALYRLENNANDEGGVYNGTWSGTPAYTTGVFGQAANFVGGSTYINTNIDNELQTSVFSYSLWFNASVIDSTPRHLIARYSDSGLAAAFWSRVENGKIVIGSYGSSGFFNVEIPGINANTWYNIVAVYNGSDIKYYLNGEKTGTIASGSASPVNITTAPIILGQINGYIGTYAFNGSIDQVRVFDRAITPLEVESLYQERTVLCGGQADTLDILGDNSCIATYQLNGNANDLSGNYSGTPTNVSYGVGEFDLAGVFANPTGNKIAHSISLGQNFAISFWINSSSYANTYYQNTTGDIVGFGPDTGEGIWITTYSGKFSLLRGSTLGGQALSTNTPIPVNTWAHVVVSYSGGNQTTFYVDGQSAGTYNHSTTTTSTGVGLFNSFGDSDYPTKSIKSSFTGSLDQVRIFNKALNSTEVTTLYNETACDALACSGTTNTLDILSDGSCIAAYPLDGSPADLSGNYNGVQTDVTYPVGNFDLAGSFNGGSSYIDTSYTLPAISAYSVSAWINKTTTGVRQAIFSDYNSLGEGNTVRASIYISDLSKFEFVLGDGTNVWVDQTSIDASPYIDGNWHNLVLIINGTSVKLYANGTEIADLTSSVSAGTAGTQSIKIGRAGDLNNRYWNGSIDQVRIFNKALSAGEVTTLYNETACN